MDIRKQIAGQPTEAPEAEPVERCLFKTKDGKWTCRRTPHQDHGHRLVKADNYGKKTQ